MTDEFRVRVSTVKMLNGVNLMTYYSERRCVTSEMLAEMAQTSISTKADHERCEQKLDRLISQTRTIRKSPELE